MKTKKIGFVLVMTVLLAACGNDPKPQEKKEVTSLQLAVPNLPIQSDDDQSGLTNYYFVYFFNDFGVLQVDRVKGFDGEERTEVLESKFGQMGLKAQGYALRNSASIKRATITVSVDAILCDKSEVFDFESPAIQEFNEGSITADVIKAFPVSEILYKTYEKLGCSIEDIKQNQGTKSSRITVLIQFKVEESSSVVTNRNLKLNFIPKAINA